MEQALKQRLIGATILISLVVIFVPMLIGKSPVETASLPLDIPAAPDDLDSDVLPLLDIETEVLAEVKIENRGKSVVVEQPSKEEPDSVEKKLVEEKPADKRSKIEPVVVKTASIPKPPKAKPVVGLKAWVIQVGSFSDYKNATKLADSLKVAGMTAFVDPSESKGKKIFRVRVGPEISRTKADALKDKLKAEHKIASPIVVQYP
ncbi:MAG: hypothetical protein A6F71_04050 [Cycloclasticus sp. symbiont of Poecilosclerida sp. M]|nr:MAG: hypothetical protein A6F71_04050 [Cycloclasticus sp. symbiont of Poecilosclerida sp. M]